jgi:hypothetical protein
MLCEIGVPSISRTGIVPNAYFEQSIKRPKVSKIKAIGCLGSCDDCTN